MLSAGQRLRRRVEFSVTIRGGRRAGRGSLVVHAATRTDEANEPDLAVTPVTKVGFVIPRTVGTAVVRNKVRRRLRHLLRDRLGRVPAGTSLVIRALPTAGGRTFQELAADLDAALGAIAGDRRDAGRRRSARGRTHGR